MTSFPVIILAVIIAAVAWSSFLQKSGSPLLKRLGSVLFIHNDAPKLGEDVVVN
jgi:hypothetical protein